MLYFDLEKVNSFDVVFPDGLGLELPRGDVGDGGSVVSDDLGVRKLTNVTFPASDRSTEEDGVLVFVPHVLEVFVIHVKAPQRLHPYLRKTEESVKRGSNT